MTRALVLRWGTRSTARSKPFKSSTEACRPTWTPIITFTSAPTSSCPRRCPAGFRCARPSSPLPGGGSFVLNSLRRLKHLAIAASFLCTSAFFGISTLHADFGAKGLASVLELSMTQPVEVMVHPSFEGELPLLLSESWARLVQDVPGGSYDALVDTRPAFTTTLEGSATTAKPGPAAGRVT